MSAVYVFLAEGFEEIEALTPVDILRRAGINVKTVGVTGKTVEGGHGILVMPDLDGKDFILPEDAVMVLLPGGGLGTENLDKSDIVAQVLQDANERGLYIAAICAAPTILNKRGLLEGKMATAFPSVQDQLTDSIVKGNAVEVDGRIITGRSAGVALQFSYALVAALEGEDKADEVLAAIYP